MHTPGICDAHSPPLFGWLAKVFGQGQANRHPWADCWQAGETLGKEGLETRVQGVHTHMYGACLVLPSGTFWLAGACYMKVHSTCAGHAHAQHVLGAHCATFPSAVVAGGCLGERNRANRHPWADCWRAGGHREGGHRARVQGVHAQHVLGAHWTAIPGLFAAGMLHGGVH
jgi:hypothetical protein